jgi:hypothetical protein
MRHFLAAIIFILIPSSTVFAGGVTSSGGDSVAAEFTMIGRHVAEILKTHPQLGVSARKFARTIDRTFVISLKNTVLNGYEVEAINYPGLKKIEVNRKRWIEHKDDPQHRYALVTHEFLGIMGIDDKKYQISYKLFSIPGPARFQVKCPALDDLKEKLKKRFYLNYTFYDDKPVAIVKSEDGDLLRSPLGETMTAFSVENRTVYAIAAVNLGIIRSVQIPLASKGSSNTTVRAVFWDAGAFGQVSPLQQIFCEQKVW